MEDALRRLLGPDEHPLSCEQCFEELDRYVEWTLEKPKVSFESCSFCGASDKCVRANECLAMRAHLESCPACNEEFASLQDLVLAERDGRPL